MHARELYGGIESWVLVAPVVDLGVQVKMAVLQLLCDCLPLPLCAVLPEHASDEGNSHGGAPVIIKS